MKLSPLNLGIIALCSLAACSDKNTSISPTEAIAQDAQKISGPLGEMKSICKIDGCSIEVSPSLSAGSEETLPESQALSSSESIPEVVQFVNPSEISERDAYFNNLRSKLRKRGDGFGFNKDLQGKWTQSCRAVPGNSILFPYSVIYIEVNGNILTRYTSFSSDETCSNKELVHIETFLAEVSSSKQEMSDLNLSLVSLSILPVTDFVRDILKDNNFCNIKDWKTGVAHDCQPEMQKVMYESFHVANERRLHWGFRGLGMSDHERPKVIDFENYMTRE
jgi:hypothetical protein